MRALEGCQDRVFLGPATAFERKVSWRCAGWTCEKFGHAACLRTKPHFPSLLLIGHVFNFILSWWVGRLGRGALLDTHAGAALLHRLHRIFNLESGCGRGGHHLAHALYLLAGQPSPPPLASSSSCNLDTEHAFPAKHFSQAGGFPVNSSRRWITRYPLHSPQSPLPRDCRVKFPPTGLGSRHPEFTHAALGLLLFSRRRERQQYLVQAPLR